MTCDSCRDNTSARELNHILDVLRADAKTQAVETRESKAICINEQGYFIANARTAITEQYRIQEFVSHL